LFSVCLLLYRIVTVLHFCNPDRAGAKSVRYKALRGRASETTLEKFANRLIRIAELSWRAAAPFWRSIHIHGKLTKQRHFSVRVFTK
jgi:hypothetical protein